MTLGVRQLLNQVYEGQIRIPAFQRGFVWDMDRLAYFIDSLYKRYPFGSFLFWRTRNQLTHERKLGPYTIPERDPEYPIDYVLDGQQRITTIFGVFQTELASEPGAEWRQVYFDLRAEKSAQDSQFFAIPPEEVDPDRHFPMKTVFDATAYREATSGFGDDDILRIDELNTRFKELQLPVQYFETEDRTHVAIVFERVNRLGLDLDTLQLLTAWTWSEDFDLQQRFQDLRDELAEYGFSDVGEDANLVLRCAAAVLKHDASAESLISLQGTEVRQRFPQVENGIRGAVDFLQQQLHVETVQNLPYPALLVPLSVFFAEPSGRQVNYDQSTLKRIKQWFWRACFSGRYSGQTIRAARADIEQIYKLKAGEESSLGDFVYAIDPEFFKLQAFRVNSASSKTFVLMLAQLRPLSFVSGAEVSLGRVLQQYNRSEFHHIYPRKFLLESGMRDEKTINCLANFCFLNRAENNRVGGRAPSEYRQLMPANARDILEHSLCPSSLFSDNFELFLTERSELLAMTAMSLMGASSF